MPTPPKRQPSRPLIEVRMAGGERLDRPRAIKDEALVAAFDAGRLGVQLGAVSLCFAVTLWLLGRLTLSSLLSSPPEWLVLLFGMLVVSLVLGKVLWDAAGLLAIVLPLCLMMLVLLQWLFPPSAQRVVIQALPILSIVLGAAAVPAGVIGLVQRKRASGQMGAKTGPTLGIVMAVAGVLWVSTPLGDHTELLRQATYRAHLLALVKPMIGFASQQERFPNALGELVNKRLVEAEQVKDPLTEQPTGGPGDGGLILIPGQKLKSHPDNILVHSDPVYEGPRASRSDRVYCLTRGGEFWVLRTSRFEERLARTMQRLEAAPGGKPTGNGASSDSRAKR